MYTYGHGSWIAIVIFAGVLVVRVLSSQRRRGNRPGGHPPANSFTASRPGPPAAPAATKVTPRGPSADSGVAPGWFRDPTGRHELRYWSGSEWTDHVVDGGVPAADPAPPAPPRREPS
ncbi:MAG TPA: DUF2510 domain-containing protein [Acidimicrobiales bacterium]|nr:DUF2510 domain-containing protein [Acidimicrobiales bacterium]